MKFVLVHKPNYVSTRVYVLKTGTRVEMKARVVVGEGARRARYVTPDLRWGRRRRRAKVMKKMHKDAQQRMVIALCCVCDVRVRARQRIPRSSMASALVW